MPTLSGTTGLRAAQDCITLSLVPTAAGDGAAAAINERSKEKAINLACEVHKRTVHALLVKANAEITTLTVSPDGVLDFKAARRSSSKNGRSGVFKWRVVASFAVHIEKALKDQYIVTADELRTYELDVDASAYPGTVISQLQAQSGLTAVLKTKFGRVEIETYMFDMSAEQGQLFSERGYVAELGPYGKVQFRMAEMKLSIEHVYAYGITGIGSAQLDLQPEFARATACSTDLVHIAGIPGAKRGMGTMVDISYPFSASNYDAVCKLIAIGEFQLINPRTGTALEITLAESPIEMQKKLGIQLLNKPRTEDTSSDDDEEVQTLMAITGARCMLVPAIDWRWRREAAAVATARAARLAEAARCLERTAGGDTRSTGGRGCDTIGSAGALLGMAAAPLVSLFGTAALRVAFDGSIYGLPSSHSMPLPLPLRQFEPDAADQSTGHGGPGGPAGDEAGGAGDADAAARWWEERGMQRAPPRWAQRARSGRHGK